MYKERRYKKRLNRYRPFLLLGNQIDGRLFCDKVFEFKNLKDLRERLPNALFQIKGEGEWDFELYQVPKEYKIYFRLGYYRYPNRGTKLFRYDYMNLPIKAVEFHDHEISFIGAMKCEEDRIKYVGSDIEVEINRIFWDWK